MWPLIKKNFAHEYWSGGFLMIAVGFSISLSDIAWVFPFELWFAMLCVISFFAFLSGGSEFSYDSSKEADRFLEYLPLKRSSIWKANFIDGILPILFMLIAALWHKTIYFTPGEHSILLSFLRSPETRWDIPLGCAVFAFWFFALNIYFRGYFKNDIVLAMITTPIIIVVCFLIQILLELLEITPSLLELAPPFAVSAALFTTAGFLMFTRIPRHVSQVKVFLLLVLPIFTLLLSLLFGHLYLNCLRWNRIEPGEPLLFWNRTPAILAKNGRKYVVWNNAFSYRSGHFLLSIDTETGEIPFYSKCISNIFKMNPPKIAYTTYRYNHALIKNKMRNVIVDPDGSSPKVILTGKDYFDSQQGKYVNIHNVLFSPHGKTLFYTVFPASYRKNGKWVNDDGTLFAADAQTMSIKAKFPMKKYDPFAVGENGVVLFKINHPLKKRFSDRRITTPEKEKLRFVLRCVGSNEETRFELSGPTLAFSANFAKVAYLKPVPSEGGEPSDPRKHPFSVVVRDIRGKSESELIPSSELTSPFTRKNLFANSVSAGIPSSRISPHPSTINLAYKSRFSQVLRDQKSGRILWLKKVLKNEICHFSLILLDLNTLERRVVSTTAITQMQVGEIEYLDPLACFTPDGTEVVLSVNDGNVFAIDLRSGAKRILLPRGKRTKSTRTRYCFLSPDCDKTLSLDVVDASDYAKRTLILSIYVNGKLARKERFTEDFCPCWLDNENIILTFKEKVTRMRFDGSDAHQVYPPK
ncbi:MAG: hypothetical protein KAG97_03795 [Victivallales bacterium]|nr:hypothetical protein [Victivallales bacterium]